MIIRNYPLQQMPDYPLERDYDLNKVAFFDIETTGFAADSTYLYLIGCTYYKNNSFWIIQWFSENIKEEASLLEAFFHFLEDYEVLLHYNGTTFDLPYLQRKISHLKLGYTFDHLISIDLYKKISPYKKILKLDSLKLKSVETFLNIHRQDTFSGGDLIEVYSAYLGKRNYENLKRQRDPNFIFPVPTEADMLLEQLLLHNRDDLCGLLLICPILAYSDLFEKPIRILKATVEAGYLNISFEISTPIVQSISHTDGFCHLTASESTATLTVQIYEGELKYFYDNYKDYYYLPAEDYAIHKSIAAYVDKEYRIKAKPSTCYTKKQGVFAPQYEQLITPNFKINHQDKLTFLEVHTDFLLQEERLEQYVHHLLTHMKP